MNQLLCKKNIPFLYLIFSVAGVGVFAATDNLYWDFSGYSLWEISLMASLFNIGVAVAELPFAIIIQIKYPCRLVVYLEYLHSLYFLWMEA